MFKSLGRFNTFPKGGFGYVKRERTSQQEVHARDLVSQWTLNNLYV